MLFDLKAAKVPQFNESEVSALQSINQPSSYDDLDWWIERTPELLRVVNAVQEDILGDNVFFDGAESAVKKAEDFWNDNFMKEELKKAIFDWLLYGDGYLWIGSFNQQELNRIRAKTLSKMPSNVRVFEWKVKDEDEVNFIRHVSSTTVNIDLNRDKTAIDRFRQTVQGMDVRIWKPSEILHAKFLSTRGKVYGFSPAMAMLSELQTIGYIKDYAKNFFLDGGTPDYLFSFPNEPANSPRLKEITEKLRKYREPTTKHGNMVVSGELKEIKLNDFSKDMEFRQLLIQLTGIIAHGYGLPAGRISSIIGAEVKVSTGSDDLANEGYWNTIAGHKDYWETLLNTQIFSRFGKVKIQFPHTHKVDEVRETQSKMQTVDYLRSLKSLGVDFNMRYVKDLLGINNEYLKSQKLQDMNRDSNFRQGQPNMEEFERGIAGEAHSVRKKKEQQTSNSDKQNLGF